MTVATIAVGVVTVSSMLETIATGVKLLSDIPGAVEALKKMTDAIKALRRHDSEIDPVSPLGKVMIAEEKNLRTLIDEFTKIQGRPDLDDYTKEKHRKRIAAQLCKLMQLVQEMMSKYIKDFSTLQQYFCKFAAA